MKEQPNYYSILTADVRYSKELNFFEKVLYADITALTNKSGYCSATNGYFAEIFDKSKETISRAISKFEKLGFLKVIILRDETTKEVIKRRLYLAPIDENINTPIDENINTLATKMKINQNIKKRKNIKKIFKPPSLEEIKKYIEEKKLTVDADYFLEYFTCGNWVDSRGNQVKNWKQKLLTWSKHNQPPSSKVNEQGVSDEEKAYGGWT